MRIQYQLSAIANSGFSEKRRSIRSSSNCSSSKQPKFGVEPRSVRDEPDLRCAEVNAKTEPHILRKRETTLGFALHLIERIARREKVRAQMVAAIRRKNEITDPVCSLESPTQQIAASPDMSRPRQDDISKVHIGPGLEALQPAPFDQVIAEPAELKSGLVVAEVRSGEQTKHYIGEARAVTVAALEAEIDCPTGEQGK